MRNKIFCMLFLLAACQDPETPREVATSFLEAFQKHDFNEAAKYSTKETSKLLEQLARIEEVDGRQLDLPSGEITIVSEEIAGNTATVFFKESGSDVEEKLMLRKIKTDDGRKWKVALSKTDVHVPVPPGSTVPDSTKIDVF